MKKSISNLQKLNAFGFTLIEVLIASGIFVVILAISIFTFSTSNNLSSKNTVLRETSQSGRYIIEAIARNVRSARNYQNKDAFKVEGNVLTIADNNQEREYVYECEKIQEEQKTRCTIKIDGRDMAPNDISIDFPEGKDYIFKQIGGTNEQPALKIEFEVVNLGEGKLAKSASQTLRTIITSRSYPGFNPKD